MQASFPVRSLPALIGLVFGGLWGLIAAMSLPEAGRAVGTLAVTALTGFLVIMVWRRPVASTGSGPLFGRALYLIAVSAELVASYAASVLTPRLGVQPYFVQAVGMIVGLHFLGLWAASRMIRYVWIAGGMCFISVAAMFLPETVGLLHARDFLTGLGNAVVLWVGAGLAIARH